MKTIEKSKFHAVNGMYTVKYNGYSWNVKSEKEAIKFDPVMAIVKKEKDLKLGELLRQRGVCGKPNWRDL